MIASTLVVVGACLLHPVSAHAQLQPVVPPDQRGRLDAERVGTHDAANIRTSFTNFGMVGDYPPDPGNVDLSVFHSVEVPKGGGLNYSDGITPFVLARVIQLDGTPAYIMETGFRERQANSPNFNRVMRFEPRPGYFQSNPTINRGRSPAISNDPRTWPNEWPNRLADPDDPGWSGSWNGYFGKRAAADQESFTVMDDQFYDAWNYVPDSRDPSRKGLGLRVEVRGFQWSNPQAGNVIFWHYDITNESTTNYVDNIVFGLYMDSGVGGPRLSCDGIFESDDDNAFFDRTTGLNLVYTWDRFGHGGNLSSNCARTGYLGYAYLETPGNPLDGLDNDSDGVRDEVRDGGPGLKIVGQGAILAYMAANYDTADFRRFYDPIETRPAYKVGEWWTGDEDADWVAEFHDVGADGVAGTGDTGEGDGIPTQGEPNFDRTDLNESDQIGLTGFKQNRIRAGQGNPSSEVDGIVFYTDSQNWPQKLFDKFNDPVPAARFDSALAANYNIAFLFASGPFTLQAGKTERFSLALAYGGDLTELTSTVRTVQQIYDANYQFAVPPPLPTVTAEAGDGRVRLSWDDVAERGIDPVTTENDFEGYRIYRATDPEFRDPRLVTTGRGTGPIGNGVPIAQFDLVNGKKGFSPQVVEGVAYWLGEDSGIRHNWTDTTAVNGQLYYYAVCSYDRGSDSLNFYPSENSISVSRTPRGGTILPTNVASVRPNPRVLGWAGATVTPPVQTRGGGAGTVEIQVVNTDEVLNGHLYTVTFATLSDDSVRATTYALRDSTDHRAVFGLGADLAAAGTGPPGDGLLAILGTPLVTTWDATRSGYSGRGFFGTNTRIKASYQPVLSPNLRRPGYPDSLSIEFDDVVRDTGLTIFPVPARPAKFRIIAHTATGDRQLDFRFRDNDANNTLSRADEFIDVVTYAPFAPTVPQITWRIELDTLGQGARGPIVPPRLRERYDFKIRKPFGAEDVFTFTTQGQSTDGSRAQAAFKDAVYVVPNPYVGSASFEPERFAVSGRGERRIEFRGVTVGCIIRIYTVTGNLVQTLRHDGSTEGFVPWNLRTKDNLDVAPGLYIFHAESPGIGTQVGKFAIIK